MNREMLQKLIEIEDIVWDEYIFHSDVMYGKLTCAEKAEFSAKAKQCARQAHKYLIQAGGADEIENLLKQRQINIEIAEDTSSLSISTFALFTQPDTITLFPSKYERAKEKIISEGLEEITQKWDFRNMALAHEFFHVYEAEHPQLFTMQKVLCLWKIGRFKNLSKLSSIREIAAAEFVRLALDLKCHPCVMEVFMLYALNEKMGLELCRSITACAEKWRNA